MTEPRASQSPSSQGSTSPSWANFTEDRKSAGRAFGLSFLQNLITFSGCSPSPVVELTRITVPASSSRQVLPTSPRQ